MNLYTIKGKSIPENLRTFPELKQNAKIERGFLLVNKPAGMTSHDVVDRIRKIYRTKKVGHGGTLDPMVTGVLPIGLGEGTKLLRFLLESGKIYDCEMLIHKDAKEEDIRRVLENQLGTITQLPPVKSRVKRVERERDIYSVNVYKIARRRIFFTVHCEAGTYIRKLCHDVGEELGTGAQMQALNRLGAGGFTLEESVDLEKLEKIANDENSAGNSVESILDYILPLEKIVSHKPKIWVDSWAAKTVQNGAKLAAPGVLAFDDFQADQTVFLYNSDGYIIAAAKSTIDSKTAQEISKGIIAEPIRIIKIF